MKKYFLLCLVCCTTLLFSQKPIFSTANTEAVTVYFNSAEITQSTNVNLPAGTSEIIVKNVSNYINEKTVMVGAPSNVTVLSVQFTKDYISEYDKDQNLPELKKVRDSVAWVNKELDKLNNEKSSILKTIEMLDKNQQIAGVNTGLNALELTKIIEYYQKKRTDLSFQHSAILEKEKKLSDRLVNLNTRLNFTKQEEEKISKGKLILQVMANEAGNVPFKISYLSGGATWTPFYDLRADNISSPIKMIYKAQIEQNTGIDWKKVKLTLSSGMPSQNNQAPILNQWFLRFGDYNNNRIMAKGQISKNTIQSMDWQMAQKSVAKDFDSQFSSVNSNIIESQLNTSFDIDIPYDIMSNGKQHSVVLTKIQIPARYKYYAVPRLDKESYLLAEVGNYSQYNLLSGEANIIFEGVYVGKTIIDPNQTSDTLNLSMGKDKRVSIKREKIVDKSGTKFFSSNKEQMFTYDITVKNNKKEKINLILKDQYPLSTDSEIKIELIENGGSTVNKDQGFLTWKLELAPNEMKKIRISYKVKSPKDKVIGNL